MGQILQHDREAPQDDSFNKDRPLPMLLRVSNDSPCMLVYPLLYKTSAHVSNLHLPSYLRSSQTIDCIPNTGAGASIHSVCWSLPLLSYGDILNLLWLQETRSDCWVVASPWGTSWGLSKLMGKQNRRHLPLLCRLYNDTISSPFSALSKTFLQKGTYGNFHAM